jgi:hypothetical protein
MNARFAQMNPEELLGNFSELQNPTPAPKALLLDEEAINANLELSNRKVAWVRNILAAADNKVQALDRNLRGDILAERADAIRKAANDEIEAAVTEIRRLAELTETQKKFYSPLACQIRATFSSDPQIDATVRLSWLERLENHGSGTLKVVAELASATDSLPLAACIAEELEQRDDLTDLDTRKPNRDTRNEIYALIDSVSNPSRRVLGTISSIIMNREEIKAVTSKTYSAINRISLGLQQG